MFPLTCTVQEDSTYWRPAQTSDAIFDQMSKGKYIEIPLSTVKKERKLGEGEFGEVFKGEWTTPTTTLTVALKTLKSSASEEERLKLLQEAAIMGQFIHPHIVRLYGVVTMSDPVSLHPVVTQLYTHIMQAALSFWFLATITRHGVPSHRPPL